jgi:hypothetical protein
MRRLIAILLFIMLPAAPALAQTPEDDVRALIARWYEVNHDKGAARTWPLMAPGGINAGPGVHFIETNPGSAALQGYWVNDELAAKALKFSYDIDQLTIDGRFAKASVWERGYFYAWAAQATYENAASAMFVLEKQADGRWLVLAHRANSEGIPPTKITSPMPDLRTLFYATAGKDRDPAADAEAAKQNR